MFVLFSASHILPKNHSRRSIPVKVLQFLFRFGETGDLLDRGPPMLHVSRFVSVYSFRPLVRAKVQIVGASTLRQLRGPFNV